jgi:Sulfotransferase family
VQAEYFPTEHMNGEELWRVLSTSDKFLDSVISAGLAAPELRYPYGQGRFHPSTGVPMICHITLPMRSEDPDKLYDQMDAEVRTWPRRPAADHYRAPVSWLAGLTGRTSMVERSGGSIRLVPLLRREFPEARFVHIHRDGPDCALSMSRHPTFRMFGLGMEAARITGLSSWQEAMALGPDELPEEFRGLLSPPFDAKRFRAYDIPRAYFGGMWSMMVCQGAAALAELPPDIWLSLRYENMLSDPETELTRLAEFLEVPVTAQWLAAAAKFVNPRRAGRRPGWPPRRWPS